MLEFCQGRPRLKAGKAPGPLDSFKATPSRAVEYLDLTLVGPVVTGRDRFSSAAMKIKAGCILSGNGIPTQPLCDWFSSAISPAVGEKRAYLGRGVT